MLNENKFDEDKYLREVLEPARQAGDRPPENLIARYALAEPLDPAQIAEVVPAVRACWRRARRELKFRRLVARLDAEHTQLAPLLEAAAAGDLDPLRIAIAEALARPARRAARLAAEIDDIAAPLLRITPEVAAELADTHEVSMAEVETQLRSRGVEVCQPDPLPTVPPVVGYTRYRDALRALGHRHAPDFLLGAEEVSGALALWSDHSPGPRVTVAGLPVTPDLVTEADHYWSARPHDGSKTLASTVIVVLKAAIAQGGLDDLIQYELAEALRARQRQGVSAAALVEYATDQLGLILADAQRLAFAIRAEQLAADPSPASSLLPHPSASLTPLSPPSLSPRPPGARPGHPSEEAPTAAPEEAPSDDLGTRLDPKGQPPDVPRTPPVPVTDEPVLKPSQRLSATPPPAGLELPAETPAPAPEPEPEPVGPAAAGPTVPGPLSATPPRSGHAASGIPSTAVPTETVEAPGTYEDAGPSGAPSVGVTPLPDPVWPPTTQAEVRGPVDTPVSRGHGAIHEAHQGLDLTPSSPPEPWQSHELSVRDAGPAVPVSADSAFPDPGPAEPSPRLRVTHAEPIDPKVPTLPPHLTARRSDGELGLWWDWPEDLAEVRISWHLPNEPLQRELALSRAAYQAQGGAWLTAPGNGALRITLTPVARHGEHLVPGPPIVVDVPERAEAWYEIRRSGPPWRRQLVVILYAHQPVSLRRVLVVLRPGSVMPLRPDDGEIIGHAENLVLRPGVPTQLVLPAPRPGPYWLRCFAPDDDLDLHDPPVDQLRGR